MKIILEGLKMRSNFIDCPDNIGNEYKIEMFELVQLAKYGVGIPSLPPLRTRAIFEWSGKYWGEGIDIINSNGDSIGKEYPRIYRLTDIIKI